MSDDKFAKIFEVDGSQILVFSEYESETDETVIHHITVFDGITAHAKVTLNGEKQETAADKYLSAYDRSKAEIFRKQMIETLS